MLDDQKQQIAKNNAELVSLWKMNKSTLSMKVLKRFLSEKEIETLLSQYVVNKQTRGFSNRRESLNQPLTDLEMEMMNAYLFEAETPIRELEARFKLRKYALIPKAVRLTARYLYQNRDLVGL